MESGFKCGSGEPGSSFCVMMDILYHVPHLCGGFFAIFNELNSKTNSGLIPKRIPSADLNNAYSSNAGITVYVCIPSDANIPKSETGFVISIKFDTSASLQLYIALNSAVIYKRVQTGSWSEL